WCDAAVCGTVSAGLRCSLELRKSADLCWKWQLRIRLCPAVSEILASRYGSRMLPRTNDPKRAVNKGDGDRYMGMRPMSLWSAVVVWGFALSAASAEDKPDATLKLSGGSVAAGIGYTWGGGTLTYKGKTYDVELSGLSIADVGATKIEARG